VHETGIYFAGVGPKSLAFERFPDIKKKKKKKKKKVWGFNFGCSSECLVNELLLCTNLGPFAL
jgi:hypothetical protein